MNKTIAKLRAMGVLAFAAVLSACTLAPRYEQPASPAPTVYEGVEAKANAMAAADISWHEFFPDSELQGLIQRALANNRDLRIATLNVEAARAQYRIRQADLVPSIDAVGASSNQRIPASLSPTGATELERTYSAGIGVTAFELDLFGRLRSLRRAAVEDYFRLEETRTAAQLVLVSEVAIAWLTLIADRELLALAEETRSSQHKSYDLTKLRFDQGVSERDRAASLGVLVARGRSRHRAADAARGGGSQRACVADRRSRCRRKPARSHPPSKRRPSRAAAGGIAGAAARAPTRRARRRTRAQGRQMPTSARRARHSSDHRADGLLRQCQQTTRRAVRLRAHGVELRAQMQDCRSSTGGANKADLDLSKRAQAHRDRALRAIHPDRVPRGGRAR
jgi:hypothetical protein